VPAELFPRANVAESRDRCRAIIEPVGSGWDQLAMGEWELVRSGFGDCHPHDEVNYVLDGMLEVDCDGERVQARPGDVVRVPAGQPAYYFAPVYARMLFVYGPNPDGAPAWTFDDRSRVAPPTT
jgi:mannose-6-phosphate isomerase-like protein (cupin superfamily)